MDMVYETLTLSVTPWSIFRGQSMSMTKCQRSIQDPDLAYIVIMPFGVRSDRDRNFGNRIAYNLPSKITNDKLVKNEIS